MVPDNKPNIFPMNFIALLCVCILVVFFALRKTPQGNTGEFCYGLQEMAYLSLLFHIGRDLPDV